MDIHAHRAARLLANAQRMIERAEADVVASATDTTDIEADLATLKDTLTSHGAEMEKRAKPEQAAKPKKK